MSTRSVLGCGDLSPLNPRCRLVGNTTARPAARREATAGEFNGDQSPSESAVKPAHSRVGAWIAALLFFGCVTAHAQYAIDWHTIDGGGGTSAGGVYAVSGTLGQSDAGVMSTGPYSLTGGFWAIPAADTTPPRLFIALASPGFVTLWWTPATPGFVLQSWNPSSPGTWADAPSGALNPVTLPATGVGRLFRLRH